MMRKLVVGVMLVMFMAVSTGCVIKHHTPPGQVKKQSAPGQMKKR